MKLAPIVVLCLAVSIHQATAAPFSIGVISDGIHNAGSIAEGIAGAAGSAASNAAKTAESIATGIAKGASDAAQGAIKTATGVAQGAIKVETSIAAGLADKAAVVAEKISEKIQGVQNAVLKGALQQAQHQLQKIQDNTRGSLQASEVAAKNAEEGLIELEDKKNELIQEWSDKAQEKLAGASDETKQKGQDLINGFVNVRAEAIKEASDNVMQTLENLQEKARNTAEKYHEPMNKLIEQVGKCSKLKVTQIRELVKCGGEIQKDLAPLASAPGDLASIKAQMVKAAGQNIVKNIKVKHALNQFRDQSKQVDAILDQLVAQDQQKQKPNPQEDDAAVDDGHNDDDVAPPADDDAPPANDDAPPSDDNADDDDSESA